MMTKTFAAATVVLLCTSAAHATDLSFDAIAGGSLQLQGEVGYGNWLTPLLYESSIQGLAADERVLESFSFFVTATGAGALTYRTAVGVFGPGMATLDHDAYVSDWQTLEGDGTHLVGASMPSGL